MIIVKSGKYLYLLLIFQKPLFIHELSDHSLRLDLGIRNLLLPLPIFIRTIYQDIPSKNCIRSLV